MEAQVVGISRSMALLMVAHESKIDPFLVLTLNSHDKWEYKEETRDAKE